MRSLRSYLPNTNPNDCEILVRLPASMREQVKIVARRHKWSTADVVRAGLQKFLDEEKTEPPKEGFKLRQIDMFPPQFGQGEAKFGSKIKK